MNITNRRLKDIQREKAVWGDRLEKADNIGECLIYQGKLECLEREEKEILKRYEVEI